MDKKYVDVITEHFFPELIKLCLTNNTVLDVATQHMKYSYFPDEIYKEIFQSVADYYKVHKKRPTVGGISQMVSREAMPILGVVQETYVDNPDTVVQQLEGFIKRARFVESYTKAGELYNSGDSEKAIAYLMQESQSIHDFNLTADTYGAIFRDYNAREIARLEREASNYVPTYIPQFDYFTKGLELGRALLVVARSGVGKSYILRQFAMSCAISGHDAVIFVSGDSTEQEIYDNFDAMWTGHSIERMRDSNFTPEEMEAIEKTRLAYLANRGEIHVVHFKEFNEPTIAECRNTLKKLIQKYPTIKLACFDYLEKFAPGTSVSFGGTDDSMRIKKMMTAEKIVGIGTEFNIAVATATQASEVPKDIWNSEDQVLTRSNISNLKATIDAFSYCITLNQTEDESDEGVIRIHEEKQRSYYTKSWERTYKVAQDRAYGWFVDIAKTKELFWDDEKKQHKK